MKNLVNFLSCLLLLACSEVELIPKTQPVYDDALKSENQIGTSGIGSLSPYVWTKLPKVELSDYFQYYPLNNTTGRNSITPINGEVYCGVGTFQEFVFKLNNRTKKWELFPDLYSMNTPVGVAGHTYLFSYQSKFYYGLQAGYESYVGSLDPVTGQRDQIADFPGIPVSDPMCFVFENKGYLMGGYRNNTTVNQFWEYDFSTNQWTNKGLIPGGSRAGGVAMVVNDKVYFGLGYDIINLNNQLIRRYKNDWYEMNPTSGSGFAAVKKSFPGTKRTNAKAFSINDKIYIGWGKTIDWVFLNDFWEFNPSTNLWVQKANCPAINSDIDNINVFTVGNAAYLVNGWMGEFWRYSNTSLVPTNQEMNFD